METFKLKLIKSSIDREILQFGSFTLKSGRTSPYFFNSGLFYQGDMLHLLGECYAETILANHIDFDHLFGPAYKGIPLVSATAVALAQRGKECTITYNRKEAKDHGEGGLLIGAPLQGKTLLIDDVISAGTAFRESLNLVNNSGGHITSVAIILDRCERGLDKTSAIEDIRAQGIQVLSLLTIYDIIQYLEQENNTLAVKAIQNYLSQYGVSHPVNT